METNTKYPKLPAPFKRKWLEALRSGNYKRATGALCTLKSDGETAKGYCCLGVAGHIQGIPIKKLKSGGGYLKGSAIKGYGKLIPNILKGSKGLPEKLAEMNDS